MVWEREAGLRRIRVLDLSPSGLDAGLAGGDEHLVPFPEPVYAVRGHDNPEFDTTLLRFTYTSMVTPESVYDVDLVTRSMTLLLVSRLHVDLLRVCAAACPGC